MTRLQSCRIKLRLFLTVTWIKHNLFRESRREFQTTLWLNYYHWPVHKPHPRRREQRKYAHPPRAIWPYAHPSPDMNAHPSPDMNAHPSPAPIAHPSTLCIPLYPIPSCHECTPLSCTNCTPLYPMHSPLPYTHPSDLRPLTSGLWPALCPLYPSHKKLIWDGDKKRLKMTKKYWWQKRVHFFVVFGQKKNQNWKNK